MQFPEMEEIFSSPPRQSNSPAFFKAEFKKNLFNMLSKRKQNIKKVLHKNELSSVWEIKTVNGKRSFTEKVAGS